MVPGSIPGGVTGFFSDILVKMSTTGGKDGRYVKLTTSPPSRAEVIKSRSLNLKQSLLSSGILYCTESDDTRCCDNKICPPEDGHVDARNMSRIVM
jgi:hypothetical protein